MSKFQVFTVGDPEGFVVEGENAERMEREFHRAGVVDAKWATVKLVNGTQLTFIMQNVTCFSYEEGDSHDN